MKKRLFALLLVCIMVMGSMIVPVLAEGTENEGISQQDGDGGEGGGTGGEGGSTGGEGGGTGGEGGGTGGEGGGSGSGSGSGTGTTCTHVWDGVTVTKQPTCTSEGSATYTCGKCHETKTETLAKKSHTYSYACDAWCDVCGTGVDSGYREVSHKYNSYWSKNSSGHWHACQVCGEKGDMADHYPGPAATEDKDQICLTCGYVMTKKTGHVHKYDTEMTSDKTGHWYACSGCEEKKDFAEHKFENACDTTCDDCGFEIIAEHEYDGQWQSDATGHWMVCPGCGLKSEVKPHEPGEAATETRAQLCTVCSFEIAPATGAETITASTEAGNEWSIDDRSHWKQGDNGERLEEALHTWDQGTDRWDGNVVYTCTVCGAERVEGKTVTETSESGGINFAMILLIVLIVLFIGAAVALVLVLRSGKKNNGKFSGRK